MYVTTPEYKEKLNTTGASGKQVQSRPRFLQICLQALCLLVSEFTPLRSIQTFLLLLNLYGREHEYFHLLLHHAMRN